MSRTLSEIDAYFTKYYRRLLCIQKKVKSQLDTYEYDLAKTEITDAVIERMYAWFGVLAFWNFGNPNTSQWGSTYFGLLDHKKDYKHIRTDVCIEHLLEQIDQHINNL